MPGPLTYICRKAEGAPSHVPLSGLVLTSDGFYFDGLFVLLRVQAGRSLLGIRERASGGAGADPAPRFYLGEILI